MTRVYLDWNATAPLRPEARAAMLEAMDVVGNPSSVHTEGRAAKAIVEKARGQVAQLVGCEPSEVVFTSGATEAAHLFCDHATAIEYVSQVEHDCLINNGTIDRLTVDSRGQLNIGSFPPKEEGVDPHLGDCLVLPCANSETGILNDPAAGAKSARERYDVIVAADLTQAIGKTRIRFEPLDIEIGLVSGHKIGAAKGVGGLILREGVDLFHSGGGQEMGRRSGTENVIGIAGFGAAAEAAQRDLEAGVWDRVETLRDRMEAALEEVASDIIFFGRDVARLPNTSCFAVPGWKGETQVMQMDLAGYAVSAGSACSSGKVKESRVLRAMGFDSLTASSAIRVSMGPTTTEDEVMGFAKVWAEHYRRWKDRRAA